MRLYDLLQFGMIVFSVLAAAFWLQSSALRLRKRLQEVNASGETFYDALMVQSRWSARGAASAGVAAFLQTVSILLPYFGPK